MIRGVTPKEAPVTASTHRSVMMLAALALVTACGGSEASVEPTVSSPVSSMATTPTPTTFGDSVTPTTLATTTTETPTTSTTDDETTTTIEPGVVVDIGPVHGDVLGVDVLNVRSGPGVDCAIAGKLSPIAANVVALGETRSIPGALWIRVRIGAVEGWINLRYVAYLGDTNDITSHVIDQLGETPEAETMVDLGRLVAEAIGKAGGESDTDIEPVMSVAPSVGDLGEVTFDVIGFADDSVRGSRLHVFGTPSESGEGFVLGAVEATALCARGVSDGSCV